MGIGAWWHWLVVLLIVVLVFGTKKLRNIGGDVGGAVKNFKEAVNEGKKAADTSESEQVANSSVLIEGEAVEVVAAKPTPRKRAAAKPAASKVAATKAKSTTVKKTPAKAKTTTATK